MSLAIISDIHGVDNLSSLLEEIEHKHKPKSYLFLGDYDTAEAIRDLMKFSDYLAKKKKECIILPGNHDHALVTNLEISSPIFRIRRIYFSELYQDLQNHPEEKAFLEKVVNSDFYKVFRINCLGKKDNALAVHGGFYGRNYEDLDDKTSMLWYKASRSDFIKDNLRALELMGLKVMIKGHDHDSFITSYGNSELNVERPSGNGDCFPIERNKLHIVGVGSLFEGDYAVIRTREKIPVVEFCRTGEKRRIWTP